MKFTIGKIGIFYMIFGFLINTIIFPNSINIIGYILSLIGLYFFIMQTFDEIRIKRTKDALDDLIKNTRHYGLQEKYRGQ